MVVRAGEYDLRVRLRFNQCSSEGYIAKNRRDGNIIGELKELIMENIVARRLAKGRSHNRIIVDLGG